MDKFKRLLRTNACNRRRLQTMRRDSQQRRDAEQLSPTRSARLARCSPEMSASAATGSDRSSAGGDEVELKEQASWRPSNSRLLCDGHGNTFAISSKPLTLARQTVYAAARNLACQWGKMSPKCVATRKATWLTGVENASDRPTNKLRLPS